MFTCIASVIAWYPLSGYSSDDVPTAETNFTRAENGGTDPRVNEAPCKNCHRSNITHENVTDKNCGKCHTKDNIYSSTYNTLEKHGIHLVFKNKEKFCYQCHARKLENLNSHQSAQSSDLKASFQSCRSCHKADTFPLSKLTLNKPAALCRDSETVANAKSR